MLAEKGLYFGVGYGLEGFGVEEIAQTEESLHSGVG